jgi:hypothetical protein
MENVVDVRFAVDDGWNELLKPEPTTNKKSHNTPPRLPSFIVLGCV